MEQSLGLPKTHCSGLERQARDHGHDVTNAHHDKDTRCMGLFPHKSWDHLCIHVVRVGFDGAARIEVAVEIRFLFRLFQVMCFGISNRLQFEFHNLLHDSSTKHNIVFR